MDAINKLLFYLNYYEKKNANSNVLARLLSHLREIPQSNVYDLADCCFVSTATLSRLIRDIGFEGFTQFRIEVGQALESNENSLISTSEAPPLFGLPETLPQEIGNYIDWYIEALSAFKSQDLARRLYQGASLLKKANRVCLMSASNMWFVQLQRELFLDGKTVLIFRRDEDVDPFLDEFREKDVYFSSVRNKTQVSMRKEQIKQLKKKNGKIIVSALPELAEAFRPLADVLFTLQGPDRDISSSLQTKLLLMVYLGMR